MRTNKNLFKILIFFLIFTVPITVFADETSSANTTSGEYGNSIQAPEIPETISKINEAKSLLQKITLQYQLTPIYKTKNKKKIISSYKLGLRDMYVAILDTTTGNIQLTGAMQNGKTFTFPDKNFDIKLIRFNGVNSKFQVNTPPNSKVIAIKYLITPVESGSKDAIENSLSEAIYVPYNQNLESPEIIAYGAKYLDGVMAQVSDQLQNYPSVSVPGKTIIQAIDPALVKALVYAEHTDSNELLSTNDPSGVINRVKVLFAINQGDTYRYSGSTAGALGISQFISSTYLGLVKRHPNANLIDDFKLGMADHVNSIKATYILLDDYIQAVQFRARDGFIPGQAFDYGVAAYNGGVVRVAKAINSFGANWNEESSNLLATKKSDVLSISNSVDNLKKKTLATKDSKKRAELQKELNTMRATLRDKKTELATIESATLKDETRGYLQKIYKVVSALGAEQIQTNHISLNQ